MKRIFKKIFCLSVSICFAAYAEAEHITYGLQNAEVLPDSQKQGGIIQVAAFKNKKNALDYQKKIQALIQYPVKILRRNTFYIVQIGSFATLAEERKTAQMLLNHVPFKMPKHDKVVQQYHTPKLAGKIKRQAGEVVQHAHEPGWRSNWYLTAGGGIQFSQNLPVITVNNGSNFPAPFDEDIYTHHGLRSTGLFTASAGRRWEQDSLWFPSVWFGLNYQYVPSVSLNGTVIQYSIPEFTNYNYHLNVASNILMGSAKLNLVKAQRFSPYITASLGEAFIEVSHYQEFALDHVTPRISPNFLNRTNAQFAYHAGAGIDMQVTDQLITTLGYLYQNTGHISSGTGTDAWSNTALNLGQAASNQVILSASWLLEG